jgi:hypothetical protein
MTTRRKVLGSLAGAALLYPFAASCKGALVSAKTKQKLPEKVCVECLRKRAVSRSAFVNKGTR